MHIFKIMKLYKLLFINLLFAVFTLNLTAQIQPQFKFWLAFEDSIGAKDTLWVLAFESLSKESQDSIQSLCIKDTLNDSTFFVFKIGKIGDSLINTNMMASTFKSKSISIDIQAQNYHLPITVRWDSSLLSNNGLPWQIKTAQLSHRYLWPCCHNMLLTNSFIALPYTWGGGYDTPFPIGLSISELNTNSVQNNPKQAKIKLYPIPASHFFTIKNLDNREIKKIEIMSNEGRILKRKSLFENKVDIMELPNGIYFLKIQTYNQTYYEKFIKIN